MGYGTKDEGFVKAVMPHEGGKFAPRRARFENSLYGVKLFSSEISCTKSIAIFRSPRMYQVESEGSEFPHNLTAVMEVEGVKSDFFPGAREDVEMLSLFLKGEYFFTSLLRVTQWLLNVF